MALRQGAQKKVAIMDIEYAHSLLRDLVALPSVNPVFSQAPSDITGEERVASFLQCWARDNNIQAQRFEAARGRPCVLLSTGPKKGPTLLVSAHMDTVWTEMEAPFSLRETEHFWHGLGAVDDKGPLVSALCALRKLNGMDISLRFVVLATCDEEFGLLGIRHIIPAHIRPDGVIIAEPTNLRIVTAHKGYNRFTIRTTGRLAHSSLVPAGVNAIYKAAELVAALQSYAAKLLHAPPHPLLGTNTLNVGVIQGGTQPNVVPDTCTLTFDFRSLPGETPASIRKHVQLALSRCDADYTIIEEANEAPPLDTSPDIPMLKHLQSTLSAAGVDAKPYGVPFTTESFRPAECGIPTIVFGPGDIAVAHSIDEKIEKKQLMQAIDLLVSLVANHDWNKSDFATNSSDLR
jgi:acetylornithine deacetylase/succinyl-diaminopimelate desuccinylase-like protein